MSLSACWLFVRQKAKRIWMSMNDLSTCPHCFGFRFKMSHVVHDEFEMRPCRLCEGKGHIDWRERESVKWGKALLDYRLGHRYSRSVMEAAIGVTQQTISDCENGYVSLDDWPYPLYNIAEVHLGRTADTN